MAAFHNMTHLVTTRKEEGRKEGVQLWKAPIERKECHDIIEVTPSSSPKIDYR